MMDHWQDPSFAELRAPFVLKFVGDVRRHSAQRSMAYIEKDFSAFLPFQTRSFTIDEADGIEAPHWGCWPKLVYPVQAERSGFAHMVFDQG